MRNLEVCLICVSKSAADGSVKLLVREYETGIGLPTAEVVDSDGYRSAAAKLLLDCTGISPSWAQMTCQPVVDVVGEGQSQSPRPVILVPLSVLLPDCATEIGKGLKWVALSDCVEATMVEDHQAVLIKFLASA